MRALPWIVSHGALVWKLALGVLAIVGALLIALVRAMRRAEHARRARAALGRLHNFTGAHDGACVTLAGVVRRDATTPDTRHGAGAVAATTAQKGWPERSDVPAPLALAVDLSHDGSGALVPILVPLRGAIRVVVGARHERLAGAWSPPIRRAIYDGDRVIVRGTLGREPRGTDVRPDRGSDDPYRADASRYVVTGEIEIVSAARPRPTRARWWLLFAGDLVVTAALVLGAMWLEGRSLLHTLAATKPTRDERGDPGVRRCYTELPRAAILAAATPFHRSAALAWIAEARASFCERDPADARATAALFDALGMCDRATQVLYESHLLAEAAAEATGCKRRFVEFLGGAAFVQLGDFAGASDLLMEHTEDLWINGNWAATIHLAAHRLDRARTALRLYYPSTPKLLPEPPALPRLAPEEVVRLSITCARLAIDARAGDDKARTILATYAGPKGLGSWSTDPACTLLLADLLAPKERRVLLEALFGFYDKEQADEDADGNSRFGETQQVPWSESPADRAAGRRAACALLLEDDPDHPCLATLPARGTEGLHPWTAEVPRDVYAVWADIAATRAPHTARSVFSVPSPASAVASQPVAFLERLAGGPDPDRSARNAAAFAAAFTPAPPARGAALWLLVRAGDSAAVARYLDRHDQIEYAPLMLGAAELEGPTDAVVDAVRFRNQTYRGGNVGDALASAGSRAVFFDALGAHELAREERRQAEAARAVLLRREFAIPLYVLMDWPSF